MSNKEYYDSTLLNSVTDPSTGFIWSEIQFRADSFGLKFIFTQTDPLNKGNTGLPHTSQMWQIKQ